MSVLTEAIKACLSPVTGDDKKGLSASVTYPASFIGFKGHFTGQPVLPGVCMLQTALEVLSVGWGQPVTLKRLISAKWVAPVLPDETVVYQVIPSCPRSSCGGTSGGASSCEPGRPGTHCVDRRRGSFALQDEEPSVVSVRATILRGKERVADLFFEVTRGAA